MNRRKSEKLEISKKICRILENMVEYLDMKWHRLTSYRLPMDQLNKMNEYSAAFVIIRWIYDHDNIEKPVQVYIFVLGRSDPPFGQPHWKSCRKSASHHLRPSPDRSTVKLLTKNTLDSILFDFI